MIKKWKDIKIGDIFLDGSKVLSIHEKYKCDTYKLTYNIGGIRSNINKYDKTIILSDTHLLLCNIEKLNNECQKWVIDNFSNYQIPTLFDKHIYLKENVENINKDIFSQNCESILREEYEVIESDPSKISEFDFWLPVSAIFLLVRQMKQKIYCNNQYIKNIEYSGIKEVFCVETDTHKFLTNDLIHHNSVTLRNVIFHCLTHGEQISIALIDLKYTEFSPYKGFKNVVAVANTVREACEIMRIGREVMYKRNQEMAKLGINDIKNFKPQKPTNEVIVAGRKLKDDDKIEIRTANGEELTVTVKELENYL